MNARSRLALWWMGIALLLVAAVALPSYHFRDWNYHTDEINTVHAARVLDAAGVTRWMAANAVHPPGWRILATTWVDLTGVQEPVTRYFSTLCTLVALALIYRLGSDLFDRWTGLYGVFLVGTIPFTLFFMHEFRPYAMLVLVTVGAQATLLRWLKAPNFKHALLFVLFGLAAVQTHYYGTYAILALALACVVVVRWDRDLYLRGFGLFAAVGLSLLSWLLPILTRMVTKSGKSYADPTNWDTLENLYERMQIAPAGIGHFLLLVGLALAGAIVFNRRALPERAACRFRYGEGWRVLYLLLPPAGLLGIALASNTMVSNLTPRNLIGLVPPVALVAAYGLRRLPWQTQPVILLIIGCTAVTQFHTYRSMRPYRELAAELARGYQPGDLVVLYTSEVNGFYFYLQDRLPGPVRRDQFYLISTPPALISPDQAPHHVWTNDPAAVQDFAEVVGMAQRVWMVMERNTKFLRPFLSILDEHYTAVRTVPVGSGARSMTVIEYLRR